MVRSRGASLSILVGKFLSCGSIVGLRLRLMHPDEERLPLATLINATAEVPPLECVWDALCLQEPSPALPISADAVCYGSVSVCSSRARHGLLPALTSRLQRFPSFRRWHLFTCIVDASGYGLLRLSLSSVFSTQ